MRNNAVDEGRSLWFYADIYINPDTLEYRVEPLRQAMSHFNILKMLEKGVCTNCFKITGVTPTGLGTLNVDIQIKHPFSIANFTGFDVRGIAMFNGSQEFPISGEVTSDRFLGEGEVVNADGFTNLYNPETLGVAPGDLSGYYKGKFATNTLPTSTLNGYKRFSTVSPLNTRNYFAAGSSITVTFEIDMPDSGWVFGYAVDGNWAPPSTKPVLDPVTDFPPAANCPEPWKITISDAPVGPGLNESGGSTVLTIDVADYGGSSTHADPVLECPELFTGALTASFVANMGGYTRWEATVTNGLLASAGTYKILIGVEDDENAGSPSYMDLTAFQIYAVEVGPALPPEGWCVSWGDASGDVAYEVEVDETGNIFVAGSFLGSPDFDPGPGITTATAHGIRDIFLSKFDSEGNFQWVRTWGSPQDEHVTGLAVRDEDRVYVYGTYGGLCDFDTGSGTYAYETHGGKDVFISRHDSDGNWVWTRLWGSTMDDFTGECDVSTGNGIYCIGSFESMIDLNPDPLIDEYYTANGGLDVFMVALDANGTQFMAYAFGGPFNERAYGIDVSISGNHYIAGSFEDTVDFNHTPNENDYHISNGGEDAYLAKTNFVGDYQWTKTWGSTSNDQANAVVMDVAGNVWVAGDYQGTVDFDPGTGETFGTSNGGYDVFLSNIASDGIFEWVDTFGGTQWDTIGGLINDEANNIYMAGQYGDTVDFNPGTGVDNHTTNGQTDAFLSVVDYDGNFGWARTWGGIGLDAGMGAHVSYDGYSVVCGLFYGTVDFDPSSGIDIHISNGVGDAYISRFTPWGTW